VARSIVFYKRLGLRLIVDALPNYVRFECPDGDSTFSVERVERAPSGHGVVVYFECEDLENVVADLKRAGIGFESGPQEEPWLWREARLKDPDGNSLCLFQAGENRKNPPWRVAE
jgi:catechol 2,3-dioxygenase-like lactoylglutathione lyase family enzyme